MPHLPRGIPVKTVGYGWSGSRSVQAVWDQDDAAVDMETGTEVLCPDQRSYLEYFLARADVELDDDTAIQQAVRFALLQVLQAGARDEGRAIPARASPGLATAGARSGTWRPSCCRS